MHIKYSLKGKADWIDVSASAAAINRDITKLSFSDMLRADLYTKKCAELLSLATVVLDRVYAGTEEHSVKAFQKSKRK